MYICILSSQCVASNRTVDIQHIDDHLSKTVLVPAQAEVLALSWDASLVTGYSCVYSTILSGFAIGISC